MAPSMKFPLLKRVMAIALVALGALPTAGPACAQDDNFIPFVISADEVVHRMLRMADVGPDDYLIDLGSGDGRIPIAAAKRYGTRALGVDLDPPLVEGRLAGRDGVHRLLGRIRGQRIEGEMQTGTRSPERSVWSAQRQ